MAGYKSKQKTTFFAKNKQSVNDSYRASNFKLSFQYLDTTQKYGSSFKDWQQAGLLSQVDGDKFALYGSFPPKDKTMFEYPKHVPEDANWARIHINGSAVIIGHIVGDTFHVVFLDKTHKFWLTRKETGK